MTALAEIRGLVVQAGRATLLRGIDLDIPRGRILGVVGESGSGKSTLALALLRLLPPGVTATGRIGFDGTDLLTLPEHALQRLRGIRIAMIFQDPMTALNPLFTIGTQLVDVLHHKEPGLSRRAARERAAAMLGRVGLPGGAARLGAYPHELSGGMRQRVAIAMALLVQPDLLIADEPTTALDATVEAQIAALFTDIRQDLAGTIVFISHHLGLVAQLCDEVCVMYGGTVVETGPVAAVLGDAKHPYTQALLACEIMPGGEGRLHSVPGDVPDPALHPPGCLFAPRCGRVEPACRAAPPPLALKAPGHRAACIRVADHG
jgi:peptide/nickel transport system ATP-binding protein